jgi:hypothetical protein
MATSSTSKAPRLDASVLTFHEQVHPRFWLGNGKLRAVVRERLRKIAAAYQQHLSLPEGVRIQDITFTGSLTGRNYTAHSDVDIHLLVDYDEVGDEALVTDYFDLKRKEWSNTYPITIYGFPVEVYVQSASQFADDPAGHYSLRKNRWVRPVPEPGQDHEQIDERARKLAADYALEAKQILAETSKTTQLAAIKEFIKRFKSLRQRGITSKAGIYSAENLAFKILRNSGSLDKLWQVQSELEAQALTLTEQTHFTTMNYLLTETQLVTLRQALLAEQTFLSECASLNLLAEQALLTEGVLDKLTEKIKTLLGSGGAPLLRKTLLAAVMGGSMLLSPDAVAQAASAAGMDQGQVASLTSELKQAQAQRQATPGKAQAGSYGAALQELNHRYAIDNADPAKTKQYMRFTGNTADVIGIGKNGYPLFQAGSASQAALDDAFANPKVITGVASMPTGNGTSKEFAGRFVKANGLYYVYTQNAPTPGPTVAATPEATPAAAAPAPSSSAGEVKPEKGYLYDFTGIFHQAQLRYNFKKRANGVVQDDVFNGPKNYTNLADYTRDFIRRSGFGLERYTDEQFDELFANGSKVRVPQLPGGRG